MTLADLFTSMANAIRAKGGTSAQMYPSQMPQAIADIQPQISLQTKTKSYTPTESSQSENVTADTGYDGLQKVNVSVGAISSTYVGSGVTRQAARTLYPETHDQLIAADTYLSGAQIYQAVTVSNLTAANIKKDVVVNIGCYSHPDRVLSVTGTYEGEGATKNTQVYQGWDNKNATSLTATNVSIKVAKAGTYKISWMGARNNSNNTFSSRLYKNGTAVGSDHTSFTHTYAQYCEETLTLAKNDVITVYCRARTSSYYMHVGNLIIIEQ